ncbi:patellin-4-like [Andrographis paniculata]|uniref:patellin-4-like n=1 Tax=Andrographis paniculata TaxID=175694 RepID=UPI0021E8F93E|nr:patellin-4-like [Andrographis paniculata]
MKEEEEEEVEEWPEEEEIVSDTESYDEDENHDQDENLRDEAETTGSKTDALVEFRRIVEEAILSNSLIVRENDVGADYNSRLKDIIMWGVPLLPSTGHNGTDAVLLKFLKFRHYKVRKAFSSLQQTLKWRADFLVDEDHKLAIDSLWFTNGRDNEGRPLFYTVVMRKRFANIGDRNTNLGYFRWRIRCVEKGIQSLDFSPGGVDSFVQIIDFKNAPGNVNREIRLTYKRMLTLLKEHYPGIVHTTLVVNVPAWFLAFNTLNLRYIAQKGNNRFIFVKPSKVTETLLKYATIENILIQYGGLKRVNDTEFSMDDKVLETDIKATSTEQITIPFNEAEITVTWDVTVVGYDVTYREEFIPEDDGSYKVLLQEKKMVESIRNSFYIREPGKIVITIVNLTYAKKKVFYRYKSSPVVPVYTQTKS